MRQRRRSRWSLFVRTDGFTLTELLLCLVVVAILTAVLFPVFAQRHHDKHVSCMSNMKQLGLALIGYTQDYDGKFPSGCVVKRTSVQLPSGSVADGQPAVNAGRTHGLGVGWAGSTFDYIKSTGVFHCPEDDTKAFGNPATPTAFPISYAMNEWVAGQSQSVLAGCATTVLGFECSGLQVHMTNHQETDGPNHSPVGDGASDPATGVPDPGDGFDSANGRQRMVVNDQGTFARHDVDGAGGGGSFWLLGDGHVKFLRFNQVSVGKQPVSQSKLGTKYAVSFNPVN